MNQHKPDSTPIDEVIDCPHTIRVLHKAGIDTMKDLLSYHELIQIRGIGKVIASDLARVISEWNSQEIDQEEYAALP